MKFNADLSCNNGVKKGKEKSFYELVLSSLGDRKSRNRDAISKIRSTEERSEKVATQWYSFENKVKVSQLKAIGLVKTKLK